MQIFRLLLDCLNKKAATPSFQARTLRQLSLEKVNRHRLVGKIVDEKYVVFPASSKTWRIQGYEYTFDNFKQDIDDYFPSFVNVIGTGFYKDGDLNHLK